MAQVEEVGLSEEGVGVLGAEHGLLRLLLFWLLIIIGYLSLLSPPGLLCLEAGGQDSLPPNILEVAQTSREAGSRDTGGCCRLRLLRQRLLGRCQTAACHEEGR